MIENNIHYMVVGQWSLPSVLLSLYLYYFLGFRTSLLIFVLATVVILIFGNRFSFAVSVISWVVFDLSSERSFLKKPVFLSLISISLFLLFGSFTSYLDEILNLLLKYDINAIGVRRLLSSIFNYSQGFDVTSGRTDLFDAAISLIGSNPIGYGMINGNNVLGLLLGEDVRYIPITYPHNFFLEFYLHFGLYLGTLFIIGFVYLILFLTNHKRFIRLEYGLFLSMALMSIQLMTSSSYLFSTSFWLFISLGINLYCKLKFSRRKNLL
ncbi:O-antigen ligase family protein [Vibrio parahaemolyticus]|nr:O-antigen ligase family protein [Vibrio parahaemolyticus]HAS6628209.1 hypothetical protein [Vibrio parahaemolyticus]